MATSAADRKRAQRERDKKKKLTVFTVERITLDEKTRFEKLHTKILKERVKNEN